MTRPSYSWCPILTPATDLIFRVQTAFECGANTEFMSRLWGWSEAVCERALHIALERQKKKQK